jgi:hypothetical protein
MSDVLKRFRCLGFMDSTDQEVRPQRRLAPRLTEGRGMVGGFLDNRKLIYSTGHGHVYEERSMRGLSARQAQVLAFI